MSLDPSVDPDIPAIIGASASLSLTGAPFKGPIGAARVGYKDSQYILNPSFHELHDSELDLVVAGFGLVFGSTILKISIKIDGMA